MEMLITVSCGVFLLVITLAYALRYKLIGLLNVGLKLAFPTLLLAVVVALFTSVPFDVAADGILKLNGTYDNVLNLDNNLGNLTSGPANLIDGFKDLFGIDKGNQTEQKGFVESQVYPAMRNTLSGFMRASTLIGGALGLVISLYLSYTIAGAAELDRLHKEQQQLLQRIAILEGQRG